MGMKLVKFSNGKYGIRKGMLFHSYLDFKDKSYWWCRRERFFKHCQTDEETARSEYENRCATAEVIK